VATPPIVVTPEPQVGYAPVGSPEACGAETVPVRLEGPDILTTERDRPDPVRRCSRSCDPDLHGIVRDLSRDRPPARRRCEVRCHPPRPGGRSACRDLSARCRRPRCVSHSSGSAEGQRGDLEERVMDVTLRATRRANGRTHSAASARKGTAMKGRRSSRSAAVVLAGCVGLAVIAPGSRSRRRWTA